MINKPTQAQAYPHDPMRYNVELMFDIMPVKRSAARRPVVRGKRGKFTGSSCGLTSVGSIAELRGQLKETSGHNPS
ncbi:hypothetical protein N7481_006787 [Penicillium waksmanii]|uniref:uncharacterized protein n=1 Tax=Penicillium waksmanii TaxID=69791 RepID=UPI0025470055|nr:uncharacterized protein N7481_006787 [Penicillium waksmanii]KAJ5984688.1 hypothetical protein N7481_006787 [Penicillium waksmanii]